MNPPRRLPHIVAALLLAASTTISAGEGSKRIYTNEEFGFSVEIPFFAPACEPTEGAPSTGIAFFLDKGMADCPKGFSDRPYISVYFEYNAASFRNARDQLVAICDGAPIQNTDPKRFGRLSESWPLLCEQTPKIGMVRIILAGGEARGVGSDVPPVNRTAELQSSRSDVARNLETLVVSLRSMKRFPRPQ